MKIIAIAGWFLFSVYFQVMSSYSTVMGLEPHPWWWTLPHQIMSVFCMAKVVTLSTPRKP